MIYLVLRDPPGGGSYATFHAGQALTFDMSVDQLETYYTHATGKDDFDIGAKEDVTEMEAPLGVGVAETGTDDTDTEDLGTTNTQKMTFSRGSESHYTVSINFTYDISTSQDPRIAGHLSDVIVGGGIDLVVSEAIQVAANITTNLVCIFAFDTYLWHPGKATTYVLPVIEIEDIINRLTRIRNDLVSNDNNPIIEKLAGDQSTVVAQLNKQLDNWNTVLSNYRSHNLDLFSAFNQEQVLVQALMQTYQTWQSNIVSNGELQSFVSKEIGANPVSIVQGLLSGSGSQTTDAMTSTAKTFKDLSAATSSLSDSLSSLANPTKSRMLMALQSSRSLQSSTAASSALSQLSDTFGTLASEASSVADAFASLVSSSIVQEFVKLITLVFPSFQSKFVNQLTKIQGYVTKLVDKVLSFVQAASSTLSDFASQVGDYLDDLQTALDIFSKAAPAVSGILNDIAGAAQSASAGLASTLSSIASFFTTVGNVATTLYNDLSALTALFPSPTTQMLNSLTTTAANLSAISTTVSQLASAVTQIASIFPAQLVSARQEVSDIPIQKYLTEFSDILTTTSSVSGTLSKVIGKVSSYARELTPLLKKITGSSSKSKSSKSTSTSSSSSLATKLKSFADKISSKLNTIEAFFMKLYNAASSSASSFSSQLSSFSQTIGSLINSVVTFINSLSSAFQDLNKIAGSIPFIGTVISDVIKGLSTASSTLASIPQFLTNLPQLLIKELISLFPSSGLKATIEASVHAFLNITTAAGQLVPSLQSLAGTLPTPLSAALSQPISLFGKVITPVSTVATSIATSFSTLLSSSIFELLIDFLALIPESATLSNDLSSINSKLVYVATTLFTIDGDLRSGASALVVSPRRSLQSSPLSTIEGILAAFSATIEPIADEFQSVLTTVVTIATDVSKALQAIVIATTTIKIIELPSSVQSVLKQLQSFFSSLSSKASAFSKVFGALSSPLSAVKPYITDLLNSLTDLSSTAGGISSSALTLSNELPTSLSAQIQGPLSILGTACTDVQSASNFLSTAISTLSSSPLLNLALQFLPSSFEASISSAFTKFGLYTSNLLDSLKGISASFSLPSISTGGGSGGGGATGFLAATAAKLSSTSSSLLSALSSVSDVTMQLQSFLSKLSAAASSIPDLAGIVSDVSSKIEVVSSTASSLAGAISSLVSALSSSLSLSIQNSEKALFNFANSSLAFSNTLSLLSSSLPLSIAPSLSPVLVPLSSDLSILSKLLISIESGLSGPLTLAASVIYTVSPDGSAQLSTYLNSVVSDIAHTSLLLNSLTASLTSSTSVTQNVNAFLPQTSTLNMQAFYQELISVSTDIVNQLASLTNDAQSFSNFIVQLANGATSALSSVSTLLNPITDLFTKLSSYASQVTSYLQALLSPFSALSPPISSAIVALSGGSRSINSLVVSVTTLSSRLGLQYPTLPTLAANLTLLSGYTNTFASDLTTLAASPALALVSNILSSQFPDLSSRFAALTNELNYLSQYFAVVSSDLSSALQSSQSVSSALSILLKSFSGKSLTSLSGLSSISNRLSAEINSISQVIGSISSTLQATITSVSMILSSITNTAASLVNTITSFSSPSSPLTRSLQLGVSALTNYSAATGALSATSYALSTSLTPPQSLALSPPLTLFAGALNQTSEISFLIAEYLSPLVFLSSLLPTVSKNLSTPLQILLNDLSPQLVTISANLYQLSNAATSQTSISAELTAFSGTLTSISTSVFNNLKAVSDIFQRLSHALIASLLPGSTVPLVQSELLSLSHLSQQLSVNAKNVTQSLNALTLPFSSLSSDVSSTIANLAHIAVTIPSEGSSFAPQLVILSSALCTLSASPSLSAYPEVSSQLSAEQSASISAAISQLAVNSTSLRSLLLSPNSTVYDEVAALGQFAITLSKLSSLTSKLSVKASTIHSGRSAEFSVLLSDVSKTFSLSAKSASSLSASLNKKKRRSLVAGLSQSKGILLGIMELAIVKGGSLNQNVPSYTFGSQNFEGGPPKDWMQFYSTLESECDLPTALDGSTPMSYDAICQKRVAAQNGDIPGGYKSTSKDSLMAFLEDPKKLITFSANSAVSLSWSSSVSGSSAYTSTYQYSSDDDSEPEDLKLDNDIEGVDIGGDAETDANFSPVTTIHIGKNINNQESHVRTVSVRMSDADNGDYFAVRITEDPIYATPIFFTEGGQSKCPGESGTSRRESRVQIVEVLPRCGPTKNQICDESTLIPGETALFGVVIQNLSPTQDEVYYTLGFSQRFDIFHRNAYEATGAGQCGTPYQRSGLVVSFSQTDLQRIPYNVLIEVPITVTQGPLCSKYNSIEVQIIATCEIPTSESQVFQYGIVNGAISYDEADKIFALNDTATFSVAWPERTSQRRTEEALNLHQIGNQSIDLGNISATIESLIGNKHDSLTMSLKESLANSLKETLVPLKESLATSLKDSIATSLKEDNNKLTTLANSIKEEHNNLKSEMNTKLASHETLVTSIHSKFDAQDAVFENKHDSLATTLKESIATSLKESLVTTFKEDHKKLETEMNVKLASHENLVTSIHSKFDAQDAKFDAVMRVLLASIGFLFVVTFILLYQNIVNQKRISQKHDEFPPFRMP